MNKNKEQFLKFHNETYLIATDNILKDIISWHKKKKLSHISIKDLEDFRKQLNKKYKKELQVKRHT